MCRLKYSLCLAFVCLVADVSAWGQVSGSITGTVVDPQGKAVANATVTLLLPKATEGVSADTNAEGSFTFPSISPLIYDLRVEATGFSSVILENVTVSPGRTTVMNGLDLKLGTKTTVVETKAAQESLDTTNAQVSTTLTNDQLQRLPQIIRDPLQLVQTQAGVSNGTGITTIDGLRPTYDNVTLDGINIQDNYYRARSLDYLPNRLFLDQISQFTLITSNQLAQYGSGATQVAFATPSGTNLFHGDLFYLASPNKINANEWFHNAQQEPGDYKRNQGGFTVSGPLKKNKLFFYVNYELLRYVDGLDTYEISPTSAERGIINAQNAALGQLVSTIPLPNIALDQSSYNGLGEARFLTPDRQNLDNVTGKLDFFASPRNSISASYLWNHERADDPYFGGYLPASTLRTGDSRNFGSVSWRTTVDPHLVNEARFGVDDLPITFSRSGSSPSQLVYLVDLVNCPPFYIPVGVSSSQNQAACNAEVIPGSSTTPSSPAGLHPYANPLIQTALDLNQNDLGSSRYSRTYTIQDNLTWNRGRHTLNFGFQGEVVHTSREDRTYTAPVLGVDMSSNDFLGLGSVYFAGENANLVSSSSNYVLGAPEVYKFGHNSFEFYGQDSFKISNRLTAVVGLRYVLDRPVRSLNTTYLAPTDSNVVTALLDPNATFAFRSGSLYKPDNHNFAPNVGIAFDPYGNGSTVVRAGYSISYANDDVIRAVEGSQYDSSLGNPQLATADTLQYPYPQFGASLPSITVNPLVSPITAANLATASPSPYNIAVSAVNPNLRTPYVQQWNFDIQERWKGTLFDFRYVGNRAIGLLRQVNLNQPANFSVFGAQTGSGYLNPDAISGATLVGNFSHSTYNALQTDIRHGFRNGLQFQLNYTWSKVLSDSASTGSYKYEPYRDASNPSLDYAAAPFDLRHAIKANFYYELPFDSILPSGVARSVLGGWSISGIIIRQSGSPFSVTSQYGYQTQVDYSNFGVAATTADALVGGGSLNQQFKISEKPGGVYFTSAFVSNPTLTSGYANPAVFANPTTGVGNLSPRAFYGPWVTDVNLGIQKTVRLGERQSIQLRGEAVNIFNHPSWFIPDTLDGGLNVNANINNSTFGQITNTSYPARKVQLTLFYRF